MTSSWKLFRVWYFSTSLPQDVHFAVTLRANICTPRKCRVHQHSLVPTEPRGQATCADICSTIALKLFKLPLAALTYLIHNSYCALIAIIASMRTGW